MEKNDELYAVVVWMSCRISLLLYCAREELSGYSCSFRVAWKRSQMRQYNNEYNAICFFLVNGNGMFYCHCNSYCITNVIPLSLILSPYYKLHRHAHHYNEENKKILWCSRQTCPELPAVYWYLWVIWAVVIQCLL